jgi:hypothetical protein
MAGLPTRQAKQQAPTVPVQSQSMCFEMERKYYGITVVLEIGLTDTLFVTLFWPRRQDLSADQLFSEPHQIDGRRKRHPVWYLILVSIIRDAYET